MDENEDLIDIRLDNVFKAVFTRETPESSGALAKLLSAITGREVVSVSIIGNEPPINNLRDRQTRFDVHCKSPDGRYFNVEISMNPDKFEPVRLEYHAGKLFTGQDIRGVEKSYDDLRETYQIAFLSGRIFFKDGEFIHEFEYYDHERGVSLGGRSRIVTVELSKVEGLKKKPAARMTSAERWAFYIRYVTNKNERGKINEIQENEEGIAMASQVLVRISRDEEERARLMSEYKYQVDTQSKLVEAKREGLREGRQEGRLEGLNEVAKILKAMGEPVEKIAGITGLSVDDVAAL